MPRVLAPLLASLALLGAVALAQEPPQQGPPQQGLPQASDPLARARDQYGPDSWPAPGPRQRALAVENLELAGWERRGLEVDPRRAEAVLTFAPRGAQAPAALVRLALHADAAAARRALLGRLGVVQAKLDPQPGPFEAQFVGREASGKLRLLLGVRGAATLLVQRIGPGGALEEVARAAEQVVLAAPLLRAEEPRPAPRLIAASVGPAPQDGALEGAARLLRLELDPGAPAADHLAFEGPPGVSVLRAADGSFLLYGAAPGPLALSAHACSRELQAARLELKLEVPPR